MAIEFLKHFLSDDTALDLVDVMMALVLVPMGVIVALASELVFMIGFFIFIPTEVSLVCLVLAIFSALLMVSMIGVGRRELILHAVTTGTGSKEGWYLEEVVQDRGDVELETVAVDGNEGMMGLRRGWIA